MSTPAAPSINVHGDSLRIGIRLAYHMFTGTLPPDDKVLHVIRTKPQNLVVNEFSLDILSTVKRERLEHRRVTAMRAMEVMLHHTGEVDHLTKDTLEKIAAKAWKLAEYMDSEENVTVLGDTFKEEPAKKEDS